MLIRDFVLDFEIRKNSTPKSPDVFFTYLIEPSPRRLLSSHMTRHIASNQYDHNRQVIIKLLLTSPGQMHSKNYLNAQNQRLFAGMRVPRAKSLLPFQTCKSTGLSLWPPRGCSVKKSGGCIDSVSDLETRFRNGSEERLANRRCNSGGGAVCTNGRA